MTDARHRLLLVSSSTIHGHGYLDHVADALAAFLAGVKTLTFVPYALADRDGYAAKVRERFAGLGIEVLSVHQAPDPRAAIRAAGAVFVGGGNTFRLLKWLQDEGLLGPIRDRAGEGMPYVGSSAGTNVAAPSIRTTNDMPIVQTANLLSLGLVPYQINPHYLDPDPASTHKGETREERLLQYLEESPVPVLGLRESAYLRVENGVTQLLGEKGARVFKRGTAPFDIEAGAEIEPLLG
ncbi:MAG: dipeptidase PepE [Holophagales bacterium]|nr:dipeptidase PepE [Holophagales bacterium]